MRLEVLGLFGALALASLLVARFVLDPPPTTVEAPGLDSISGDGAADPLADGPVVAAKSDVEDSAPQVTIDGEPSRAQVDPAARAAPRLCSGTLRDPDGRPVESAHVVVFRPHPLSPGGQVIAEAVSDDEGRYAVEIPREAGLKMAVSTDGFQELREDLDQRGLSRRDFVLQRAD